jgi:diacylglycerol kinase (ATP)
LYRHLEVFVPLDDIRPLDKPTDWVTGQRYS